MVPEKTQVDEIDALAQSVFGSAAAVRSWLRTPQVGLNQKCPLELMQTDAGAEIVKQFLQQLSYGVYA